MMLFFDYQDFEWHKIFQSKSIFEPLNFIDDSRFKIKKTQRDFFKIG